MGGGPFIPLLVIPRYEAIRLDEYRGQMEVERGWQSHLFVSSTINSTFPTHDSYDIFSANPVKKKIPYHHPINFTFLK